MNLPDYTIKDERFRPDSYFVIYPDDETLVESKKNYLVVEVDIKSAYPTFLKLYFSDKYKKLIEEVEKTEEKIKKNILISTRAQEILPYLQQLSKVYLLSFMEKQLSLIDIVELKKDGGVFIIPNILTDNVILEHYFDKNVLVRVKILAKYLRRRTTSFYKYTNNRIEVKGKYKKLPLCFHEFTKQPSKEQLADITLIYSFQNPILVERYYKCFEEGDAEDFYYVDDSYRYNKEGKISTRAYREVFAKSFAALL